MPALTLLEPVLTVTLLRAISTSHSMSTPPKQKIRVLHIDDEPSFTDLTATFLERSDDQFTVETATSAEEGVEKISDHPVDCVVSDYDMPGTDGIEFLQTLRQEHSNIPFILFTARGSETVASEAISAGITDYLEKKRGSEQYELLGNRIKNAVYAQREARRANRQETLMRLTELAGESGGWELNTATDDVVLTPGAQHLLGTNSEKISFEQFVNCYRPSDCDEVREAVDTAIRSQTKIERMCRVGHTDDALRQIDLTISSPSIENGVRYVRGAINDVTEHKRGEQKLRRYKHLLESINDAVFVVEQGLTISYVNRQSVENLGLTVEAVEGEPIMPLVEQYATGRASVREFEQALITALEGRDGDPPSPVELTVASGDTEFVYEYKFSRLPVRHAPSGQADTRPAVAVVAHDITDRKQREQELVQTQELMSDMTKLADVGAWEYDAEADSMVITDGFCRVYGLQLGTELSLEEALAYFHADDRERLTERFTACLETGQPYRMDVRIHRDDGEQRWVTAQGERIERQGTRVVRGCIQDITEKKERINTLEQSETLFENAQDMLFIIDVCSDEFVVRRVNPAYESTTGISKEDIQGKTPAELFGETRAEKIENRYQNCIETGESLRYEETLTEEQIPNKDSPTDDGLVYWKTHLTPVEIDGTVEWIVGATRDINQQKRREHDLERRNTRLDEFTSIISHDLRNPLNVVGGRVELARDDCDSEHLAAAADAVDRCQALIDDTLTLARQGDEIGTMEPVVLSNIAEQSWQTTMTESAELCTGTDKVIHADGSSLQQLFENLYRNAVEHGGREVTVRVGEMENGFYVADTGVGIPESDTEVVFDAGYSTGDDGTGFGLRIVEAIADAHGWNTTLTESKQGGVRFEFSNVSTVE